MRVNIVSENAVALIMCILNKDLSRDVALRKCGIKVSHSKRKSANKPLITDSKEG